MSDLSSKITILKPTSTIADLVSSLLSKLTTIDDFAVVCDERNRLLGVINVQDILRSFTSGASMDTNVQNVMSTDPVTCRPGLDAEQIYHAVEFKISQKKGKTSTTRYIPVVDESNVLLNVLDLYHLASTALFSKSATVYGLGFVGITLSVVLSSRGFTTYGIDNNSDLIADLLALKPRVYEPKLVEMLSSSLSRGLLKLSVEPTANRTPYYIISVGTPIDSSGVPCLDALKSVLSSIASNLRPGDLILLRSTVPVGTTRSFVIPFLESLSNLEAGTDFHIAFTPERTVEGDAIKELGTLPQIIGGLTPKCTELASSFWQLVSPTTVAVESLEAAELIKLLNNSFRDLSFAFSNAFVYLADQYNLDASHIISCANDGYPRNPIPRPSPGVGGYCLTKDPYLYASTFSDLPHSSLSQLGRSANHQATFYPVHALRRFCSNQKLKLSDLTVVVFGIAFKGFPETNDLRGSTSLDVCRQLMVEGVTVYVKDAVIHPNELRNVGLLPLESNVTLDNVNAYMYLNNHPGNVDSNFLSTLPEKPILLFDGWSLFDRFEVEQYPFLTYSTLGYMTPLV